MCVQAQTHNLNGGWPIDKDFQDPATGRVYDLRNRKDQNEVRKMIRRDRPLVLTVSPPCTVFSIANQGPISVRAPPRGPPSAAAPPRAAAAGCRFFNTNIAKRGNYYDGSISKSFFFPNDVLIRHSHPGMAPEPHAHASKEQAGWDRLPPILAQLLGDPACSAS